MFSKKLDRLAIIILFLITPFHIFSAGSYDLSDVPVNTNDILSARSLWQPNTEGELEPAPEICGSDETVRSFYGLLPLSAVPGGALKPDLETCIIEVVSSVLKQPVFAPELDAVYVFQDRDTNVAQRVICITIISITDKRSMSRACSITPKEKANWGESELRPGPTGRITDCALMLPECRRKPRKEPYKVQLAVNLASEDLKEKPNHDILAHVTYHYGTGLITVEMQYTLSKSFS